MIKDGPMLRKRRKYRGKILKELEERKVREEETLEQREERERAERWTLFCKDLHENRDKRKEENIILKKTYVSGYLPRLYQGEDLEI